MEAPGSGPSISPGTIVGIAAGITAGLAILGSLVRCARKGNSSTFRSQVIYQERLSRPVGLTEMRPAFSAHMEAEHSVEGRAPHAHLEPSLVSQEYGTRTGISGNNIPRPPSPTALPDGRSRWNRPPYPPPSLHRAATMSERHSMHISSDRSQELHHEAILRRTLSTHQSVQPERNLLNQDTPVDGPPPYSFI